MLETPKFPEIDHPAYFVGGEHPIHQCFEEFSSDVSSDLPPDVISAKFGQLDKYLSQAEVQAAIRELGEFLEQQSDR